ncbi:MAG: hypothetical protein ACRBB0_15050 [Pelagimonas sp.]|uniref:hypothetical protein n=1 Tax=Pelagimonas sp. TaxID=2073170 RepID=UPI003D6B55F9
MTKNIFVAIAPDGSEYTRKTDRTYTHAVLLKSDKGWGVIGFCGRFDLADKKRRQHPNSVVVECGILGAGHADESTPEAAEYVTASKPEAEQVPKQPRRTIGRIVEELLVDEALDYAAIVDRVVLEFPKAKTTARSVASVAAVMRKKGLDVPSRRRRKGT